MKSKKSELKFNGTNSASTQKRFTGSMFSPALLLIALLLAVLSPACGIFDDGDDEAKPCNGKECLNGGTLTENTCDCKCLPGFTGATCETELTPQSIKVKEIIVTKFPEKNTNGKTWDPAGAHVRPDIKVIISYYNDPNNPVNKVETDFKQDADFKKVYSFKESGLVINLPLNRPADTYMVSIYDVDPGGVTEFMEAIIFSPYKKGKGFPETLTLQNSKVAFKLVVDYEH